MREYQSTMAVKKTKVCYVVCYSSPDYIRTLVLVRALQKIPGIELKVVKNRHLGWLRYLEVPLRLLWVRLSWRPRVFVVGFRAHEIFWALYPAMIGKPIIFDEFIDHHDWIVNEHQKPWAPLIIKPLDLYMRLVMKLSKFVLTDTEAHSQLAIRNYHVPASKVISIPIGSDEQIFKPRPAPPANQTFEIFFFGNMLPLHGLTHLLEGYKILKDERGLKGVHMTVAGGKGNQEFIDYMRKFSRDNKMAEHLTHLEWIPFEDIPDYIAKSNLGVGGPFGNTGQARRVITGKAYQFLAMARPTLIGKPEVATKFKNHQNCLLVEQASAEAIAKELDWAISHRVQLEKIGRAGYELFERDFSTAAIAKQLAKLIEQIN